MLHRKLKSFQYAFKGFVIAAGEEDNFQIHIVLFIFAVLAGVFFQISLIEWLFVVGASGMVFSAELFNTALEELCDMLRPTHDPHVAKIKDLSAAAVFVASIAALVIGLIIFIPHIL